MLQNLHVKNLALIKEIEIDFEQGLNILTGETGAGKSIILGSLNLALGGKYSAEMLRKDAQYGLVELVFSVEDSGVEKKLEAMDIFPEEGQLILSRKLMEKRSVSKINGETVSMSTMRNAASLLIDIYGQHEHQTLLNRKNHLMLVDEFGKKKITPLKESVKKSYENYRFYLQKLEEIELDDESRKREIDFLTFEINEIEEAGLTEGEDELLEQQYRRMSEGKKLTENLSQAYQLTGDSGSMCASDALSHAIRYMQEVSEFDEQGAQLYGQLVDVDSLLNDFNRELSEYQKQFEFSEEEFRETEERLNLLNRLKAKYGNSVNEILEYQRKQSEKLEVMLDYDAQLAKLRTKKDEAEDQLRENSLILSKERQSQAKILSDRIRKGLAELNFLDVRFDMRFENRKEYSADGLDHAEFYIATNPGEAMGPLANVASGGELSRIMLAVKTVLADEEDTDTLIFDEIDTGISGITAAKVAKQMALLGKSRQVICITHLPQIASKADIHFLIEKAVDENRTSTRIQRLDDNGSIKELARILGGDKVTESILSSAKEMKELAKSEK